MSPGPVFFKHVTIPFRRNSKALMWLKSLLLHQRAEQQSSSDSAFSTKQRCWFIQISIPAVGQWCGHIKWNDDCDCVTLLSSWSRMRLVNQGVETKWQFSYHTKAAEQTKHGKVKGNGFMFNIQSVLWEKLKKHSVFVVLNWWISAVETILPLLSVFTDL